jgi:hypothetical protein
MVKTGRKARGGGLLEWGTQEELARSMGVSRSVITRDVKLILSIMHEPGRCAHCGGFR